MLETKKGKGIVRAGIELVKAHPLTDFEIQKCYVNEPRFNGVFSRDNLVKKRMGNT